MNNFHIIVIDDADADAAGSGRKPRSYDFKSD